MKHTKGKIIIAPVQDLLQKSVDNIRLKQIQAKVDLEAELEYNGKYIGSPMPQKDYIQYIKEIGRKYLKREVVNYLF